MLWHLGCPGEEAPSMPLNYRESMGVKFLGFLPLQVSLLGQVQMYRLTQDVCHVHITFILIDGVVIIQ